MSTLKKSAIGLSFLVIWGLVIMVFNLQDNWVVKGIGIALGIALGTWAGSSD